MNHSPRKLVAAQALALALTVGASREALAATIVSPGPDPVLTAETNLPNNSTFILGQEVDITFSATGLSPGKSTPLFVKVEEAFGYEIASITLFMTANSSGMSTVHYTAPALKYGFYKVKANLIDGTLISELGTRPAGFVTYAVIVDPAKRTNYGDAHSLFGMQGGFSYNMGNMAELLGVRYMLQGPGWGTLEASSAGQFATTRAQKTAAGVAYPAGLAYKSAAWPTYGVPLLTAASIPSWALLAGTNTANQPGMGALNPAGVIGWPQFVKARAAEVVADFANQSEHYYQVTWEPEIPVLWGGTPAQLVQYYSLAYSAIHQADPKALVTGPTTLVSDSYTMVKLWAAGLANYIDAVSIHPYERYPPEAHNLVSDIRTQMSMATTAKGHAMPFIATEHGLTSDETGSYGAGELGQAVGDIRATLIVLGEGFKFDVGFYIADFWGTSPTVDPQAFGYYYNLNPAIKYGTDKISPKATAAAYAAMTYIVDGATAVGALPGTTGTQLGYRFARGTTNITAVWDYKTNSNVSVPVTGTSVTLCDWMGNCRAATPSGGVLKVAAGIAPTYVISK